MADTFFEKFTRCAKVCGYVFAVADWLDRQTPMTWLFLIFWFCFLSGNAKFKTLAQIKEEQLGTGDKVKDFSTLVG